MQLLSTQSSFPAFPANTFNPVIQSSKSQLESNLNSTHAGFVCARVCEFYQALVTSYQQEEDILGDLLMGGEVFYVFCFCSLVFLGTEGFCE